MGERGGDDVAEAETLRDRDLRLRGGGGGARKREGDAYIVWEW